MNIAIITEASRNTLYYNGNCPLCSKEMEKLDRQKDARLELIDINRLERLPKPKQELIERLHLQTASGEWLIGLDANIAAWEHTPKAKYVSVLHWPVIYQIAQFGYSIWLLFYKRGLKRRECTTKTCQK